MKQEERWEDPQAGLDAALQGQRKDMWTAIPGIVVSREGNNVTVNPAIQGQQQDPEGNITNVNMPQLINVPLVMPGGGGFAVTLPIAAGDEVLVVFASRCIDGWWQGCGIQPQVEVRMHDLSDGFAIPAPMSQPKALANISATTAQLRSTDGTVYVEVAGSGKVNIVSPGDVTITGNLNVTGEITAGFGTGDSVTLQQHKHTETQPGSGQSGIPLAGS